MGCVDTDAECSTLWCPLIGAMVVICCVVYSTELGLADIIDCCVELCVDSMVWNACVPSGWHSKGLVDFTA